MTLEYNLEPVIQFLSCDHESLKVADHVIVMESVYRRNNKMKIVNILVQRFFVQISYNLPE